MALSALATASAPAALPTGPIMKLTVVSTATLRPGVKLIHYRAIVSGYAREQEIYKVAWAIGDSHVSLHSALLGTYHASNQTVDIHQISTLGSPPALVAAVNGDFSAYTTPMAYRNSGMLVRGRRIYNFGWGGPGVGYTTTGDFLMGRPSALPLKLRLPNGSATVGALNGLPTRGDQVGAYVIPRAQVSVPAGYTAFTIDSTLFRTMLRGTRTLRNTSGLNVSEPVVGFYFGEPSATAATLPLPIRSTAVAGAAVNVPTAGTVLLASNGGIAATGLTTLAARATPAVTVSTDAQGWAAVSSVMGGKPQLVSDGVAISARPSYVDDWQWTCGGGCWRPALVRSGSGQGWLIVVGASNGSGLTMPVFAKVLTQLGAVQAMGFDNNGSAELYRPGTRPITAYGYERWLPSATTLYYR